MKWRKSWSWYALYVLLLGFICWHFQVHNPYALVDSDTVKIIHGIKLNPNFWLWWHHDWPLANHFYRPLSTLAFQLDLALYHHNPVGWDRTDSILVCLSVLSLGWFMAELTLNTIVAALSTTLFVVWVLDYGSIIAGWVGYIALGALILGAVRHRLAWRYYLPAFLVWTWVSHELFGISTLYFRSEGWIPGRTATTMTIFAFVAMAAFSKYCRTGPSRKLPNSPTALDRPATKSTVQSEEGLPKGNWVWLIISVISTMAALACYEQAVMVPPLLGLIAVYWHFKGKKAPWWTASLFAAVLCLYVAVHLIYVPHQASTYYNWQKRTLKTSAIMFQRYFFFPYLQFQKVWVQLTGGILLWLFATPWLASLSLTASIVAMWQAKRKWLLCGFGWLGSSLAYLPMTFYKDFGHYHYWPMAIRTLGVTALAWVAVDLTIIAVSPPAVQAPPRSNPAPGSLHHQ